MSKVMESQEPRTRTGKAFSGHWKEKGMQAVFFIAACTSILAVALICVFLFANGLPAIAEIGPLDFLLGKTWRPANDLYGIFPFILGSIYVTAGAIVIGVPIGILTSIFMAEYCPAKIYRPLKAATELLAGIPSVVYGFFGMLVLVPFIRETTGSKGNVMLTACILLGIMILPTIINVAEASIRALSERQSLPSEASREPTMKGLSLWERQRNGRFSPSCFLPPSPAC